MKLTCTINNDQTVTLDISGNRKLINGKESDYQLVQKKEDEYQLILDGEAYEIRILSVEGNQIWLLIDDYELRVETKNELDLMMVELGMDDSAKLGSTEILAPMPGTILEIMVAPDQKVEAGESLLVLNAMKMENVIKAPGDGQIDQVSVSKGDNVNKNQVLISFKA